MFRIITLFCVVLLAACSKSAPTCSSDEAKELVMQIAGERPFVRGVRVGVKDLVISVESIRTQSHNSETGSYECAAELQLSGTSRSADKEYSRSIPVTYITEISDNSDQFFVTLSGL